MTAVSRPSVPYSAVVPAVLAVGAAGLMGIGVAADLIAVRALVGLVVLFAFGFAVSRRTSAGAVALMAIAASDGIPLVGLPGGVRAGLLPGIIAVALASVLRWGGRLPRLWPVAVGWSTAMVGLIVFGWVRVWVDLGTFGAMSHSVTQSSDVLALAILPIPLMLLLGDPVAWRWALTVFAGALLVRAGLRFGIFLLGDPENLVGLVLHPTVIRTVNGGGVQGVIVAGPKRLVSAADASLAWMWPMCLAYFICGPLRHRRAAGLAVALILTSIALNYGRALYLGALITVVWMISYAALRKNYSLRSNFAGRRIAQRLGIALLLAGAYAFVQGGTVVNRLSTLGGDTTGTAAYRVKVTYLLLAKLHGLFDQFFGLGFVSPLDRYDPSLWRGTLWNPDVGLVSVLVAMGALGLIVLLAAVVWLFFASLRALRSSTGAWRAGGPLIDSSLFGTAGFCVYIVSVSGSLFLGFGNGPAFAIELVIGLLAIEFARAGAASSAATRQRG